MRSVQLWVDSNIFCVPANCYGSSWDKPLDDSQLTQRRAKPFCHAANEDADLKAESLAVPASH